MHARGVADVQRELERLQLAITIVEFDSSTATSQEAAENVGCELGQIVKSLGFMIQKERPVLVLASGDQTVDDRKLAALFDVGRKRARMMNPDQCLSILGYTPGGVPPVGHRSDAVTVLLDKMLQRYHTVYAAGGAANAIFTIELTTLQRVTQGTYADIARV